MPSFLRQPPSKRPPENSCQRQGRERRQAYLRSMLYAFCCRQRRDIRRQEDQAGNFYMDHHAPHLLLAALTVLLLSLADSILTIRILEKGGQEINPLMRFCIECNFTLFFIGKFLLTLVSVVLIIVHDRFQIFRRIRGSHILYTILLCYTLLICYEAWLLH